MGRPIEQLSGAHFLYPPLTDTRSVGDAHAGRTTLSSGSASVTVSTNRVGSDSVILKTAEVASVGVGANSGGGIVVNSIVDGVSFAFAQATGVAVPWDTTVMWLMINDAE